MHYKTCTCKNIFHAEPFLLFSRENGPLVLARCDEIRGRQELGDGSAFEIASEIHTNNGTNGRNGTSCIIIYF